MRDLLKGWARKDGALAGTFSIQYAPVGGAGPGLELVQVGQVGVAAQLAGARAWQRVSAGSGAKGPRWYDWALIEATDPP